MSNDLEKQYDQDIQKQKTLPEKIATSRRWLRDAKQGKLMNVPSGMMERIVPRGYNYYTRPGENIDQSLIKYIQADLEYLESSEEEKQKDAMSLKPDKKQVKKVKHQDYIKDKNVLKEILQQLALPGNAFVDAETSKNWEQIYENHFKDTDLICSGNQRTRINWTGTWGEYCIFYDRSARNGVFQGRNFDKDLQMNAGTFFEDHFLFRGESKTNKQVADGYRRAKPDRDRVDNINKILKKYSNSPALTS